jgi:hypothetical protein
MSRKRFTAEQIIGILREADVELSRGKQLGQFRKEFQSIWRQNFRSAND